jgi:hypothetical protein
MGSSSVFTAVLPSLANSGSPWPGLVNNCKGIVHIVDSTESNFSKKQINDHMVHGRIMWLRTCSTPEGEDCEPKNDIIVCDRTVRQNTIQFEVLVYSPHNTSSMQVIIFMLICIWESNTGKRQQESKCSCLHTSTWILRFHGKANCIHYCLTRCRKDIIDLSTW